MQKNLGQAVMAFNGTVDFFIHNVFNFPTLAQSISLPFQQEYSW